ncbi:MAG: 2-succinyl-5-enolpyruvyl-6-hydroxy-3-cyclohexene-1-carboxylic-acid synthase [Chloroflexi bacterium]|nr:2-succinyl-5-enolpyruvyl-6-hydroxy-3-cyclohexene-1-carboxylic-acid synthase [Chloroflexota bacterium]
MKPENRNILWASMIVDELARHGVRWAVIAPGSRSTPLVVALARHPQIKTISIIDERSAAFLALGIGMATRLPAVVVCSSGTAAANFYPAVIEARQAGVPLLILTADRPPELRDSGANQTIDQVRMYGSHALWSVDVSLPEQEPPALAVRSLRTLAARAFARACGVPSGPVHLNLPFRKPLEPTVVPTDITDLFDSGRRGSMPFSRVSEGALEPTTAQVQTLLHAVENARRAIIFAGPFTPANDVAEPLAEFAKATGIPVFADPLSNLRWSSVRTLGAYDSFGSLRETLGTVNLWIQLGGQPASKAIEDYLVSGAASRVIQITDDGVWRDPYHQLSEMIHVSPALLFRRVAQAVQDRNQIDRAWVELLWARERAVWQAYAASSEWFDGAIVARCIEALPEDSNVVVASSLPIRNVEQFTAPRRRALHVYCNRGASGIDGTVSTAYGIAAASERPTCLIIGDLALLHDIGGLLSASRVAAPVVIVVVNNDGGGIFRRLPVKEFEPAFTDLFLTPHGRTFEGAASMYGLSYVLVGDLETLQSAVASAMEGSTSWLIEARTDSAADLRLRAEVMQDAAQAAERVLVEG